MCNSTDVMTESVSTNLMCQSRTIRGQQQRLRVGGNKQSHSYNKMYSAIGTTSAKSTVAHSNLLPSDVTAVSFLIWSMQPDRVSHMDVFVPLTILQQQYVLLRSSAPTDVQCSGCDPLLSHS